MKILVIGTRGIPNIQGGVETHCQELYPRLVKLGCEVILLTRSCYVGKQKEYTYQGVKVKVIYAPRKKSIEAIIHTLIGVLIAKKLKPDIIHIHSIGPALFTPIFKLLGFKIIFTHHGPDYNRAKWGRLAKTVLKLGEYLGVKYSDKVIAISTVIENLIKEKYNCNKTYLVYNGVNLPVVNEASNYEDILKKYNLQKKEYVVAIGRFVKEKGFHDLINAYSLLKTNFKLVLVGDADHEDQYSKYLKALAKEKQVILTGFLSGESLKAVFMNARLFVLPSYHEGLPIVLLEAMSYNLDVLVSNIPANLEVPLEEDDFFKVGDIDDLSIKLQKKLELTKERDFIQIIANLYNWDKIAEQIFTIYKT